MTRQPLSPVGGFTNSRAVAEVAIETVLCLAGDKPTRAERRRDIRTWALLLRTHLRAIDARDPP